MTIDEAIRRCDDVADYDYYNDKQCEWAEDHRQLAVWLRQLKAIHEVIDNMSDDGVVPVKHLKNRMNGAV